MKLSGSILSLLLVSVSADISAKSVQGKRLLEKARPVDSRQLDQQYYSWIGDYTIKFTGCVSVPRFEREEGFRGDLLAKFKLCPSNSCGSCRGGGEYVVDMGELLESYQEYQQNANEQVCESAQQTCEYQCQNSDNEYCESQCLSDAGMSYCDNENNDNDDMRDIGECRALNEDQDNQNNYYGDSSYEMYYVGLYCTSKGVYAGTFKDSACTKKAPSGTYEKMMYGASLPTDALLPMGCIMDCAPVQDNNDNNNNNNNNQNAEPNDTCSDLYEQAAKCEKNVSGISYKDTSGCELIQEILPRMNHAFKHISGTSNPASSARVWAWIFGILCVFMGIYIYLLHKRVIREKVDMASLGLA